jgi:hypothetical protein
MRHTSFNATGEDRQRTAIGYKDGPSGTKLPNTDDLPLVGSPANMAFSTAGDMARFADALYHGRLLSASLLQQFWTGVTGQPDGVEYGYGARIERYNGRRIVWHGGGAPGVTNRFEMVPHDGMAVVVLSNCDTEPEIIANKLREWLSPCRQVLTPVPSPPDLVLSARQGRAAVHRGSAACSLRNRSISIRMDSEDNGPLPNQRRDLRPRLGQQTPIRRWPCHCGHAVGVPFMPGEFTQVKPVALPAQSAVLRLSPTKPTLTALASSRCTARARPRSSWARTTSILISDCRYSALPTCLQRSVANRRFQPSSIATTCWAGPTYWSLLLFIARL